MFTSSAKRLFEILLILFSRVKIQSIMISASKHVLFGFNLFHVSSLTYYVNSSVVAQNAFCLFKIPLNDAFLKGTVEIKEFRFYCKLPLAIHFHFKYFNCIFFLLTFYPINFCLRLLFVTRQRLHSRWIKLFMFHFF